jgi:hypothetical protein
LHRCAASLLVLVSVAQARAAELPELASRKGVPVEIRADSVELDSRRALYEARGSVVIRQGERVLHADWVVFNERTGHAVASGHVVLEKPGERLAASFLEFDVRELEGVVFDAELETPGGGFRISGAEIARVGPNTYRVRDGVFTTCNCPEPGRVPWRITADRAEIEVGGYGTARNTTLDVLEVPVVWLPWMLYPFKTERQTGLLLPELHVSRRGGVEVGLPFFWAVRPDVNLTLTPRWLSKRGPMGYAELEYVQGQHSEGRLAGSFLHDQEITPDTPATPYGADRWSLEGQQDLHLPESVRVKTAFAFASDNDYPFDFRELAEFRRDRFLESWATASRGFGPAGRFGAGVGARFADDMQNPDDRDRDHFLLQRLPAIGLKALSAPLPGARWLVPALDVDYAHFWRPDDPRGEFPSAGAPVLGNGLFLDTGNDAVTGNQFEDPTENDNAFEEGEPLGDRGSRLDLWPRLGVPLRLFDLLELKGEAGWRETLYATEEQSFARRGFFTGLAELRTSLRRDFGDAVHVLEPGLSWTLISDARQGGNPLFVPATAVPQERVRQLELSNVIADPADRVEHLHALTWGLGNRIYRRGDPKSGPLLLADFALSNQFDLGRQEFRAIVLDGRAYPYSRTRLRFNLGFDPRSAAISEGLAELSWSSRRGDTLSLGYRYLRKVPAFFEDFDPASDRFDDFTRLRRVSQVDAHTRIVFTERWSATYAVGYSFEDSFLIRNRGSVEYFSRCGCWAAGIAASDDRSRGFVIGPLISIVGLGGKRGVERGTLEFLDVL